AVHDMSSARPERGHRANAELDLERARTDRRGPGIPELQRTARAPKRLVPEASGTGRSEHAHPTPVGRWKLDALPHLDVRAGERVPAGHRQPPSDRNCSAV